jgi:hypothetical protein
LITGVIAASFISNIGHAFRRGEFFADLFILGFPPGLSPDHPEVATDLNNLALFLSNPNRLAEAEPM